MDNNNTILRMAGFIRSNGDRFKMLFILDRGTHSTRFNLTKSVQVGYDSLEDYLTNQIELFKPKSITVTTKKYNGNSGGRDPQTETFYFNSEKMEVTAPIQNQQPKNLAGLAQENPYAFQIHLLSQELEKERKEKVEYKTKAKKYKKSYQNVKLTLDTIEEKHDLQRAKAEYENGNSGKEIIKELLPTLQGIIPAFGKNNEAEEVDSLQGVTNPLLSGIIEMAKTLEGQDLKNYFEFFVRIANCTPENFNVIMEGLRSATPSATESINQQINA